MDRRTFLALASLGPVAALNRVSADPARHPLAAPWAAWKEAHLDVSGRVVDRIQESASHSEGQGYGMMLAVLVEDEPAFAAMFDWTEANLAVRDDALLAWRWLPDAEVPVPDRNNASDGDLFYAWALLRAGDVFDRLAYRQRADAIVADLVVSCIRETPGQAGSAEQVTAGTEDAPDSGDTAQQPPRIDPEAELVLLPAAFGFEIDGGYVINPSYYMLRAMQELAAGFDQPLLAKCASDGEAMLTALAEKGPVPDWVQITSDGWEAPADFSSNSGYEALRVPLFLLWSGRPAHPAVRAAYAPDTARDVPDGLTATVIEAGTGAVLETSDASGYRAITALISCAVESGQGSALPPFDPAQPYYPATLQMFAYLTQIEVLPECFPI